MNANIKGSVERLHKYDARPGFWITLIKNQSTEDIPKKKNTLFCLGSLYFPVNI